MTCRGDDAAARWTRRKQRLLALAPIALVVVAACGGSGSSSTRAAARQPLLTHGQLTVAGEQRTYRLYRPASVDAKTPTPLVIVLHGNSSNGDDMAQTTQFDMNADASGFIAVYPNGIERSWNGGFCCEPAPTLHVDDVAFLNALIPSLEHEYAVDEHRVYITGFSSGAILAYRYACEGSQRIAAIAPVAGTMMLSGCQPRQPLSILAINGTADGEVPYQGGHLLPGASATDAIVPATTSVVNYWTRLDRCSGAASTTTSGPVSVSQWSRCANGVTVELQTIAGAGHTWYATGFGPADGAIDASTVIASFLAHLH